MKSKIRLLIFGLLLVVLVGCDRVSKEIARDQLKGKPAISYMHDTFRLDYTENTGAFLGLGARLPRFINLLLFRGLPLIVLLSIAVYVLRKRNEMSVYVFLAFILVLSGGFGNIIDRFFFDRHVVDFLNVGIDNLRTGIFNFADFYITTGVIALLFFYRTKTEKKPVIEENNS